MKQLDQSFNIVEIAENLHPAYFALVMATGIVSIAAFQLDYIIFAWCLFVVNVPVYVLLWILTIIRSVKYPRAFWNDVISHERGPGFFTIVAGTCVLGTQFIILYQNFSIALYLLILGGTVWLLFTYLFFTFEIIKEEKPTLQDGINGAWLIVIVATQSVSILGVLIIPHIDKWYDVLSFIMLILFFIGCMLYILVITLIFYRFIFYKITPFQLSQPYWINMGAVAITTLAGATLILNDSHFILLQDIRPFLKGFTLFFWAFGTWWIPLLFLLGHWRHIYKKFSFRYDPLYWGMVFPLGMYSACTFQLARALDLPFLLWIPRYFIYIAIAAWMAGFTSLIYYLITSVFENITKGEET